MSGTETIFAMPDRDALANALVSVDGNGHTVRGLYPAILRRAGQPITPLGFVVMMMLATHDYTRGLDRMTTLVTELKIHLYARAIITDPAVLDETLDAIKAAGLADGR